jgi:hypothetical protein
VAEARCGGIKAAAAWGRGGGEQGGRRAARYTEARNTGREQAVSVGNDRECVVYREYVKVFFCNLATKSVNFGRREYIIDYV